MDLLRLIKTFVRVADSGSFSAVAREERTTQSAISKQVQALEAELGTRLLVRSTRQHTLTEAGQRFYERGLQLLDTLDEARAEIHQAEHALSGVLRVSAPVAFGRLHIVPRLAAFFERHPKLHIDLVLDDAFVDLVAAGVDVTFRAGELRDSRLVARRIGSAHRVVLAAPAYLARHGVPQRPEDLKRHRCLIYTGVANRDEWTLFGPDERKHTVRVSGNFESNSSEALRQAVREGLGIAYSPQALYGDDLRAGRLIALLPRYRTTPLPLNVVYQPARRPSLKVKAFVDYFTEAFALDPDIAAGPDATQADAASSTPVNPAAAAASAA